MNRGSAALACLACTLVTGAFAQTIDDGTATPRIGGRRGDPFTIGTDIPKRGRSGPCGPQSSGDCPWDIEFPIAQTPLPGLGGDIVKSSRGVTLTGCVAVGFLSDYGFTQDAPKDSDGAASLIRRLYQLAAVDTLDLKVFAGKHVTIAGSVTEGANALIRTLTARTIKETSGTCK